LATVVKDRTVWLAAQLGLHQLDQTGLVVLPHLSQTTISTQTLVHPGQSKELTLLQVAIVDPSPHLIGLTKNSSVRKVEQLVCSSPFIIDQLTRGPPEDLSGKGGH
jgi:hypothetical protein